MTSLATMFSDGRSALLTSLFTFKLLSPVENSHIIGISYNLKAKL